MPAKRSSISITPDARAKLADLTRHLNVPASSVLRAGLLLERLDVDADDYRPMVYPRRGAVPYAVALSAEEQAALAVLVPHYKSASHAYEGALLRHAADIPGVLGDVALLASLTAYALGAA